MISIFFQEYKYNQVLLDEKYKDPSLASRRKGKKTKNLVPETGIESTTEEDQN